MITLRCNVDVEMLGDRIQVYKNVNVETMPSVIQLYYIGATTYDDTIQLHYNVNVATMT